MQGSKSNSMTHPQAKGYYDLVTARIDLNTRLQCLFDEIDDLKSDVLNEMRDTIGDHLTVSSTQEVQAMLQPTYSALTQVLVTLKDVIEPR